VIDQLVGFTVQVSVLVVAAFLAVAALRRFSAALRHWVLSAAVVAAAALPALQAVVPDWGSGFWPAPVITVPASHSAAATSTGSSLPDTPGAAPLRGRAGTADAGRPRSWAGMLLAVWLIGAAVGFALLGAGLARLAFLDRRARPVTHPDWTRLAGDVAADLGVRRRVALLHTGHASILVAWGWLRPRIMVPRDAMQWPAGDIEIVLRHELAHIARGDWIVQLLAEALCAINWFNPLLWMLPQRLRAESECACDDVVLQRGVEGPEYAERLLALARALNAQRRWSPTYPAPSMARRSSLERRVAAMLSTRVSRSPLTASARAVVVMLALAVALPIAGLAVFAQARASFSGSVLDPASRVVPNTRILLTNTATKATQEVRSDAAGRFEFPSLDPGNYIMEASQPGFMTIKLALVVTERGVQRDFSLKLGSLQEMVVVKVSVDAPGNPAGAAQPSVPPSAARATPAAVPCPDPGTTGGHIIPPKKIHDAKPAYPDHLRADKIAGSVTVEGVVGRDGTVHDLKVIETPHADLGQAVVDAVSRWAFNATRLNCEPVDVKITVIARFVY
jgi:TonB family protein